MERTLGPNRAERRRIKAVQNKHVAELPDDLVELPRDDWPAAIRLARNPPERIWRSRHYLVQLFQDDSTTPPKPRLSICRARLGEDGRWESNLTWDELQYLKHLCGFGEVCAVEIYPRDANVVNVANMRHLWLLMDGDMGWIRKRVEVVAP